MQSRCDHTVHHVDPAGRPQGSWAPDLAGLRIECRLCGRFYGYLPEPQCHRADLKERVPRSSGQAQESKTPESPSSHPAPVALRRPEPPNASPALLPRRRSAPLDYKRLRQLVSMSQVLELIGFEPTSRSGQQLRGPCPVHQKDGSSSRRQRVFSVDAGGSRFQCFGRECGIKGNQLDLWAAVTGLELYEAALDLCDKAGIEPPFLEAA